MVKKSRGPKQMFLIEFLSWPLGMLTHVGIWLVHTYSEGGPRQLIKSVYPKCLFFSNHSSRGAIPHVTPINTSDLI